jgi:hypothetical protein
MHTLEQLRSGSLAGARRLDLNAQGLTRLPPEVYGLADTLEVLNLSDNLLDHLPPDLPRLHRLKVVFCSGNPFTHLPEVLGDCPALEMVGFKACRLQHVPGTSLPPNLRWLTLTDNAIEHLPPELGQRPALQKLMLAGNRLSTLPDTLAGATRLELMRLSANGFRQLPGWLAELPALAWLALSGNPLGWTAHVNGPDAGKAADVPTVPWADLRLDGLLGEGASGRIHRVHRAGDDRPQALKLFKGSVTSDGLPEHELAACVAAGPHPALCTPHATLCDHPLGLSGMLLPLVPADFVNLAGPPSLDSCTRDVYPEGLQMHAPVLLQLACSVASALAHLHARGILHGDVYAHNILWQPATGRAMLSDLGAATRLPLHEPVLAHSLQALDVLAFGHLLHELLACGPSVVPEAMALAQACVSPAMQRPAMADVAKALNAMLH